MATSSQGRGLPCCLPLLLSGFLPVSGQWTRLCCSQCQSTIARARQAPATWGPSKLKSRAFFSAPSRLGSVAEQALSVPTRGLLRKQVLRQHLLSKPFIRNLTAENQKAWKWDQAAKAALPAYVVKSPWSKDWSSELPWVSRKWLCLHTFSLFGHWILATPKGPWDPLTQVFATGADPKWTAPPCRAEIVLWGACCLSSTPLGWPLLSSSSHVHSRELRQLRAFHTWSLVQVWSFRWEQRCYHVM